MFTTISRWGNSQGLRIPKAFLDTLGLKENDQVEISCQDGSITIRKSKVPHRTLEERLTAFYGKPLDQLSPIIQDEVPWGGPEGQETW